MRALVVTQIFPNAADPLAAAFNRQQFTALARRCELDVLAAIPWFPGARFARRWSLAGRYAGVPRREVIAGLEVRHPRFAFIPKVARSLAGPLYAASLAPSVLASSRRADVVLATWAYPDAWAAIVLARLARRPCVVKLHGSDINVIAKMPGPRRLLEAVLPSADRVVAVSQALGDEAAKLGVSADRIDVIPNGVDNAIFYPRDRQAARAELGVEAAKVLLYVGRLDPKKGIGELLEAFAAIAARRGDVRLVIVGDGPAREACEAAAETTGAIDVMGARPHAEIPTWLAAADALVLPSYNEGMPNVVLEALACGRRVVATTVGGIPEVVTSDACGTLVPPRQAGPLEAALAAALDRDDDPADIAAASPVGSWDDSAAALHRSLERAVRQRRNHV